MAPANRVRPEATKVETARRQVPLDARAAAWLEFLRRDPRADSTRRRRMCSAGAGTLSSTSTTRSIRCCCGPSPPAMRPAGASPASGSTASPARCPVGGWPRSISLFSDLRHEGALRKYRAGWHLNEIQRLLGHRNIQQTSTYLGVGNDDLAQAMIAHGSGAKHGARRGAGVATDAIRCNPRLNIGQASAASEVGKCRILNAFTSCAPVAQLDRAPAF